MGLTEAGFNFIQKAGFGMSIHNRKFGLRLGPAEEVNQAGPDESRVRGRSPGEMSTVTTP
jgi:hypothetical protein